MMVITQTFRIFGFVLDIPPLSRLSDWRWISQP